MEGETTDSLVGDKGSARPSKSDAPEPPSKSKDLDTVRTSVADTAGVVAGVWLSYIFVLLYLFVAAAGVTHRSLFFESLVKLPFLNIELPLRGFFWFGPAMFLVVHLYVLLHLALLSNKVCAYERTLREQVPDEEDRAAQRHDLAGNFFVQLLAGPDEVRTGLMGFLLRLVTWITVVLGPVALLVFFQIQFLPYHNAPITWWQRITVLLDTVLLWALWPSVVSGASSGAARRSVRILSVAAMTILSLVPILFVVLIATFPGEPLEERLARSRIASILHIKPVHYLLFVGEPDPITRKPKSVWSNRLVLVDLDVIDHTRFDTEAKIAAIKESVSLRGRNLRGAVLTGAILRSVDFTGADLREAEMNYVDLRGAELSCATVNEESCVQLQGASLSYADLRGVGLGGARLQGALLELAQLQGANLNDAVLQGANLVDARLQAATLGFADLRAANLIDSHLSGAYLEGAQLEGALLRGTELQGTDLRLAKFDSAIISNAFLWRADDGSEVVPFGAHFGDVFVSKPETAQKTDVCEDVEGKHVDKCEWTPDDYSALESVIEEQVPSGSQRQSVLRQIERLDPSKPLWGEKNMARRWYALANPTLPRPDPELGLVREWIQVGCETEGAPYVLEGIIYDMDSNGWWDPVVKNQHYLSPEAKSQLAAKFLDKQNCAASSKLSKSDEEKLKQFLKPPEKR